MPQKKKLLFTTEQMIEFAKSCVKEFQLEANKTNPNNGDIVRATVDLPIPALTIPEAEVDSRGIIESHCHNGDFFPTNSQFDLMEKAMHKYSDLRLAKAMEENKNEVIEFAEWVNNECYSFDPDTGTYKNAFETTQKSSEELYQLFLADKKKGEGK